MADGSGLLWDCHRMESRAISGGGVVAGFLHPISSFDHMVAMVAVGLCGVPRGHAHGTELPAGSNALLYSLAFVIANGLLHLLGILLGETRRWTGGRRLRGHGGVVVSGAGLSMTLPLAHLEPTALGPWGDGMARLFLEPTEVLLVIGLVLLGVQAGRSCSDRLPLLLPLAWLAGGVIGLALPRELLLAVPSTAMVAGVGLLVALEVRLRPGVVVLLAAVLIALFALAAGSALAGHAGALPALLGEAVGVAVLGTLLATLMAPPHPRWRAIGLRVGGSWITAASLLMLGWLVRHPQ